MNLLQLSPISRLLQLSHISRLQSPMPTVDLVYVPRGSLASLGGPFLTCPLDLGLIGLAMAITGGHLEVDCVVEVPEQSCTCKLCYTYV